MAQYFDAVDLGALQFAPIAKQGKLYVVNLETPLVVTTPPLTLAASLSDDTDFALLQPTGAFEAFLKRVETWVLDACLAHKAEWFRKDVDDDALRHNFKSFFREGQYRVKAADVAVFDASRAPAAPELVCEGTHVRAVLELTRICFGRQEFGAMWRLVQARAVEVPPCLIGEEDDNADGADEDEQPGDEDAADPDEHEFL